jgi:hypothetical protein
MARRAQIGEEFEIEKRINFFEHAVASAEQACTSVGVRHTHAGDRLKYMIDRKQLAEFQLKLLKSLEDRLSVEESLLIDPQQEAGLDELKELVDKTSKYLLDLEFMFKKVHKKNTSIFQNVTSIPILKHSICLGV